MQINISEVLNFNEDIADQLIEEDVEVEDVFIFGNEEETLFYPGTIEDLQEGNSLSVIKAGLSYEAVMDRILQANPHLFCDG